jgi:hypothetical protein
LRQDGWEKWIWKESRTFSGSWPVSEGSPTRFGASSGPGKFDHTGAAGFWRLFWGDQGGAKQLTEGWSSMWIRGSVFKGICRTVGKRSTLSFHSLMALGKCGPADFCHLAFVKYNRPNKGVWSWFSIGLACEILKH